MGTVFLSYRRADSEARAGRLNDGLELRFGKDLVFQDVEDIEPGDDWRAVIDEGLDECAVFLAVIGPRWLGLEDARGQQRIALDDDVLRYEIEQALDRCPRVVPVVVGGAQMPVGSDLPETIRPLADRQAVTLRDESWTPDVRRLMEQLRRFVIETRPDVAPLDDTKRELYELQRRYFDALDRDRDPAGALQLAQRATRLLDRILPLHPDDPWLKSTRGYSYKNESMALRRLGRNDEADAALARADRVFTTMVAEDPTDASAWNGQGSVASLRGDLQGALELIDRALELDPTYDAAWRDRQQLLSRIGERPFSIGVGDRVAGTGARTGTVVAQGVSVHGPMVLVQWDDAEPGDLENRYSPGLTRLDVEAPH